MKDTTIPIIAPANHTDRVCVCVASAKRGADREQTKSMRRECRIVLVHLSWLESWSDMRPDRVAAFDPASKSRWSAPHSRSCDFDRAAARDLWSSHSAGLKRAELWLRLLAGWNSGTHMEADRRMSYALCWGRNGAPWNGCRRSHWLDSPLDRAWT